MNTPNPDGQTEMAAVTETCIICEQSCTEGISICGHFICGDCEAEIIRTDVLDAKYPFFISQMKRVWYKKDA